VNLFQRKPRVKGYIGYFRLTDWWLSTFSADERTKIEKAYQPMGGGTGTLTQTDITYSSSTISMFLSGLSSWFTKTQKDREIARRILKKAVEVGDPKNDVLGLHFTYQALIEVWYRDRETHPDALSEATAACLGQIGIAHQAARQFKKEYPNSPLPSHVGYTQLTIIYDHQGRYDEAIKIAQQAKQQSWNGDWDARIQRYEKKRTKPK
jgi:tetratricopeptide (TPR) repeat protein